MPYERAIVSNVWTASRQRLICWASPERTGSRETRTQTSVMSACSGRDLPTSRSLPQHWSSHTADIFRCAWPCSRISCYERLRTWREKAELHQIPPSAARAPDATSWFASIRTKRLLNNVSLAAHLRAASNALPDVERAALRDPDCSEPAAAFECVLADLLQRAGKRDLFDPTGLKAFFSDIFYAALDFKSFEIVAVIKCPILESLQRGGKFDVLYRTPVKNCSLPVILASDFLSPEFLQAFI